MNAEIIVVLMVFVLASILQVVFIKWGIKRYKERLAILDEIERRAPVQNMLVVVMVLMLASLLIGVIINTMVLLRMSEAGTIEGRTVDILASIGFFVAIGLSVSLTVLGQKLKKISFGMTPALLGVYVLYSVLYTALVLSTVYAVMLL